MRMIEVDAQYELDVARTWLGECAMIPSGAIAWNIDHEH